MKNKKYQNLLKVFHFMKVKQTEQISEKVFNQNFERKLLWGNSLIFYGSMHVATVKNNWVVLLPSLYLYKENGLFPYMNIFLKSVTDFELTFREGQWYLRRKHVR